jgi:hypothetical protein
MGEPEFTANEINLLKNLGRYQTPESILRSGINWRKHYRFLESTYLKNDGLPLTEKQIRYLWFIKNELQSAIGE